MKTIWEKENNQIISISGFKKWLNRAGFTAKKSFKYAESYSKKRKRYFEEIKNIDPKLITYSMDDNEVSNIGYALKVKRCGATKKASKKH